MRLVRGEYGANIAQYFNSYDKYIYSPVKGYQIVISNPAKIKNQRLLTAKCLYLEERMTFSHSWRIK